MRTGLSCRTGQIFVPSADPVCPEAVLLLVVAQSLVHLLHRNLPSPSSAPFRSPSCSISQYMHHHICLLPGVTALQQGSDRLPEFIYKPLQGENGVPTLSVDQQQHGRLQHQHLERWPERPGGLGPSAQSVWKADLGIFLSCGSHRSRRMYAWLRTAVAETGPRLSGLEEPDRAAMADSSSTATLSHAVELRRVLEIRQCSDLWVTHRSTQSCHGVDDVLRQPVKVQGSVIDLLPDQLHVQNLVQLRSQSDVTGQQQGLEHLKETLSGVLLILQDAEEHQVDSYTEMTSKDWARISLRKRPYRDMYGDTTSPPCKKMRMSTDAEEHQVDSYTETTSKDWAIRSLRKRPYRDICGDTTSPPCKRMRMSTDAEEHQVDSYTEMTSKDWARRSLRKRPYRDICGETTFPPCKRMRMSTDAEEHQVDSYTETTSKDLARRSLRKRPYGDICGDTTSPPRKRMRFSTSPRFSPEKTKTKTRCGAISPVRWSTSSETPKNKPMPKTEIKTRCGAISPVRWSTSSKTPKNKPMPKMETETKTRCGAISPVRWSTSSETPKNKPMPKTEIKTRCGAISPVRWSTSSKTPKNKPMPKTEIKTRCGAISP
ncbi:hypothetical protein INR49_023523, partial [Caranx melampygus]